MMTENGKQLMLLCIHIEELHTRGDSGSDMGLQPGAGTESPLPLFK